MERPRYEKGDRVWVLSGHASLLPGVVIGYYVDWDLYRVVYMIGIAGGEPRAVEQWRLWSRGESEER
jgi:hypothetical protein